MSKLTSFGDSFQPVQRPSIMSALLMPTHHGFQCYRRDAKDRITLVSAGHLPMIADVAVFFLTSSGGLKGQNDL